MNQAREVFWLERPYALFSNMRLIPRDYMNLAEQMNALTRFVFLVFLVLHLFGFHEAKMFLMISLIFIIVLYYLQKKQMSICESYEPDSLPASALLPKSTTQYVPRTFSSVPTSADVVAQQNYIAKSDHLYREFVEQPRTNLVNHPSYFNQQVAKSVVLPNNQRQFSYNQQLVGNANPKTKVKPVIVPPCYEWAHWKDNDFVVPQQINTRSVQDYYGSGYYVDQPPVEINDTMKQMKRPVYASSASSSVSASAINKKNTTPLRDVREAIESYDPVERSNNYFRTDQRGSGQQQPCAKAACTYNQRGVTPILADNGNFTTMKKRDEPLKTAGDIDDVLVYDPSQLDNNWPSNYPAGNCQLQPEMKEWNKNLFTSTIVPGVYYRSEIVEPISSNIGISFTQQVPPRKVTRDDRGNLVFEAKDPRQYEPEAPAPVLSDVPSTYDVFDPRFDGYGASNRTYIDKLTGQPRFFYDDVDAIRRPNYVTRSDIDFLGRADTYGPIADPQAERAMNERIRFEADQSFTEHTLDFRTDMMNLLMRKRNAELWQTRLAPKTTMKK